MLKDLKVKAMEKYNDVSIISYEKETEVVCQIVEDTRKETLNEVRKLMQDYRLFYTVGFMDEFNKIK